MTKLTLAPLQNLSTKINQTGFMICGDSNYFHHWIKTLYLSIQKHAPWAHIHFHLFDPSEQDIKWMQQRDCTFTWENIPPEHLATDLERVLYLGAARYMRVREIYTDDTVLINQDADSLMVRDLPKDEFLKSLDRSWVPTALKREQLSLCSAFGVGPDDTRHIICERYSAVYGTPEWIFAYDQRAVDRMIAAGEIGTMDLRYTDFKFSDSSYIWTGKGDRVYKSRFKEAQAPYLAQI
jgi:hypothetical protein